MSDRVLVTFPVLQHAFSARFYPNPIGRTVQRGKRERQYPTRPLRLRRVRTDVDLVIRAELDSRAQALLR